MAAITMSSIRNAFILLLLAGALALKMIFFNPPAYNNELARVSSDLNERCPIMIDEYTRLDNTSVQPSGILEYHLTLLNTVYDSIVTDSLKTLIRPILENNYLTHPDLKFYRDKQITLAYNFKDKTGNAVISFIIDPDSLLQMETID